MPMSELFELREKTPRIEEGNRAGALGKIHPHCDNWILIAYYDGQLLPEQAKEIKNLAATNDLFAQRLMTVRQMMGKTPEQGKIGEVD